VIVLPPKPKPLHSPRPLHHEPRGPHSQELHLPPHLVEQLRWLKPHEIEEALRFARKQSGGRRLLKDAFIALGLCAIIGLALNAVGVSVSVILPALAPIWVGVTTLLYSMKE
jgi:Flp pilus assembly protein TadB